MGPNVTLGLRGRHDRVTCDPYEKLHLYIRGFSFWKIMFYDEKALFISDVSTCWRCWKGTGDTLIKNIRKLSSYIRKFRGIGCKVVYE
jgi:hypothetical protein